VSHLSVCTVQLPQRFLRALLSLPHHTYSTLRCHLSSGNDPDSLWQKADSLFKCPCRSIRLWRQGKQVGELPGHEGPVLCLAVTEAGELLSGSGDHTIRRWQNKSCAQIYKGHTDTVRWGTGCGGAACWQALSWMCQAPHHCWLGPAVSANRFDILYCSAGKAVRLQTRLSCTPGCPPNQAVLQTRLSCKQRRYLARGLVQPGGVMCGHHLDGVAVPPAAFSWGLPRILKLPEPTAVCRCVHPELVAVLHWPGHVSQHTVP